MIVPVRAYVANFIRNLEERRIDVAFTDCGQDTSANGKVVLIDKRSNVLSDFVYGALAIVDKCKDEKYLRKYTDYIMNGMTKKQARQLLKAIADAL